MNNIGISHDLANNIPTDGAPIVVFEVETHEDGQGNVIHEICKNTYTLRKLKQIVTSSTLAEALVEHENALHIAKNELASVAHIEETLLPNNE